MYSTPQQLIPSLIAELEWHRLVAFAFSLSKDQGIDGGRARILECAYDNHMMEFFNTMATREVPGINVPEWLHPWKPSKLVQLLVA